MTGSNVWTVLHVGEFAYKTRPAHMPVKEESRSYKPRDVIRYERMIRKLLPDCRFRCLSNIEIPGIECVPITSGLKGWWPKMELFRPDLPGGRNIYFDLDTIPLGGLREIENFPAPFAAATPKSKTHKAYLDQEGRTRISGIYQTSVMVWDSDYGHRFWEAFGPEHVDRLASDQDFLAEMFPNEARMPAEWFAKIMRARSHQGLKVVLTMPYRNDRAAEIYPWVRKRWCND